MNTRGKTASLLAAGAIVVGGAGAGLASAQSPHSTPTSSSSASNSTAKAAPDAGKQRTSPLKATLDGLVKKGTITSAQEKAILDQVAADRAKAPRHGHHGERGEHRFGHRHLTDAQRTVARTAAEQATAKALGISVDQYKANLKSGQSVRDMAKKANVSPSTLRADVRAAIKAALAQK